MNSIGMSALRHSAACGRRSQALYGCLAVALLALLTISLSGCGLPGDQAAASTPTPSAVDDYNAAVALTGNNHCDRAIPLYLRAIGKNDIYLNAYFRLAGCYQTLGEYKAAIIEYDKAIAIDPTNYGLYISRANAEAANGTNGLAQADDETALRLAPPQAPTYNSIALSFSYFQDFADAINAMDKALALVPNSAAFYEQRANFYLSALDTRHAYADYKRALDVTPSLVLRAPIYADLANVYSQQQQYDSAFGAIASAIRILPDNANFYVESGDIHQGAGAYTPALKLYDHALKLVHIGPTAESAYEGKGDVLAKMGRATSAVRAYRQALRLTKNTDIQARLKAKIQAAQAPQS